ncbi:hypothetical protein C8R47DRAFT_937339, partial [Mycena vitilis]
WATERRSFLTSVPYGPEWSTLVDAWYAREEAAGFEVTRHTHSATKRPAAVTAWVSRARNHIPKLGDIDEFGRTWWGWWIDINPTVRGQQQPLQRKEIKDWEGMDICGQNGFLNVLATLKWWRDALETESSEWKAGVDDVTWVIQEML